MLTAAIFLPVVTEMFIHVTTSCFRVICETFIDAQVAEETPAVTEQ